MQASTALGLSHETAELFHITISEKNILKYSETVNVANITKMYT